MSIKTFSIELISGVPIIRDNDHVILLDTGSPYTIHNSTSFNFLDKNYRVQTSAGAFNIENISEKMGMQITTLLGMDILKDLSIIFDYHNNQISLSEDEDFEGEEIAININSGIPVIPVLIIDQYIPMLLDSGAQLSYLKRDITQHHKNLGETEDFYPTIGRFTTTKYLIFSGLGPHLFEVFYGNLPKPLEGFLSKIDGNNGILGYDFFAKFKLCLNMKKKKVILMEGPRYH